MKTKIAFGLAGLSLVLTYGSPLNAADTQKIETRKAKGSNSLLFLEASNSDDLKSRWERSYKLLLNERATLDPQKKSALSLIMGNTPGDDLGSGEFYTFLRTVNQFDDAKAIKSCGLGNGNYTIASIRIEYQGAPALPIAVLTPQNSLFVYARGVSTAKPARYKGCTFTSASNQAGPYILYTKLDPGYGEYVIHLKGTAGYVTAPPMFAKIAKLAGAVSAAWPGFISIAQPVASVITTVASDLDDVVANSSVESTIEYSATLPVFPPKSTSICANQAKPSPETCNVFVTVSSPRLKNIGEFDLFISRSASIVVDANPQEIITPDDVLTTAGLGNSHRCIPGTNACSKDKDVALFDASFDLYGDTENRKADTRSPPSGRMSHSSDDSGFSTGALPDSNQQSFKAPKAIDWGSVASECARIKAKTKELGLSKIDALLVRWAILERNRISPRTRSSDNSSLSQNCWDATPGTGDEEKLRALEVLFAPTKFSE